MVKEEKKQKYFVLAIITLLTILVIIVFAIEKGDVIISMNKIRTPNGNIVANYLTMMSEGGAFVIAILLLLFFNFASSISMAIVGTATLIISYGLKILFHHPRPFLYFVENNIFHKISGFVKEDLLWSHSSFPSGHTLAAFSLTIFLSFILPRYKYVLLLAGIIVALTRIYLVHHFLEDVVFGAFCGLVIGVLGHVIYLRIYTKSKFMQKSLKLRSWFSFK